MGLLCPFSYIKNLVKSQLKKALLGKKRPSTRASGKPVMVPWGVTPVISVLFRSEDAEESAHGDACGSEGPQIHVGFV